MFKVVVSSRSGLLSPARPITLNFVTFTVPTPGASKPFFVANPTLTVPGSSAGVGLILIAIPSSVRLPLIWSGRACSTCGS